jgi:hypothetical protein
VITWIEKDITMKQEEAKSKGFKVTETETVIDEREQKLKLLNSNIQKTWEEWGTVLPTLIQDLNTKIKDPRNKASLI